MKFRMTSVLPTAFMINPPACATHRAPFAFAPGCPRLPESHSDPRARTGVYNLPEIETRLMPIAFPSVNPVITEFGRNGPDFHYCTMRRDKLGHLGDSAACGLAFAPRQRNAKPQAAASPPE